jgi:hypothetical protein
VPLEVTAPAACDELGAATSVAVESFEEVSEQATPETTTAKAIVVATKCGRHPDIELDMPCGERCRNAPGVAVGLAATHSLPDTMLQFSRSPLTAPQGAS